MENSSFKEFLLEIFLHDLRDERQGDFMFIAFRQNLWIGNHDDLENHRDEIVNTIIKEHPRGKEILADEWLSKEADIFQFIEFIPDAVVGQYNPLLQKIYVQGDTSLTTSPLIKKVAAMLRAQSAEVERIEDRPFRYHISQLRNQLPAVFYHGTSTEYLQRILRFGLMPMPGQTNYKNTHHDKNVFISVKRDEAEGHAFHTARGGEGASFGKRKQFGWPMLLTLTLPDPSKLVPDFDDDRRGTRAYYNHDISPDAYFSVPSEKAGMHSGIFGYQGRIPANFIKMIRVYSFYRKRWIKIPPKMFQRVIDKLDSYGDEFWYNYLGNDNH